MSVTPENKFLENIISYTNELESTFLIANPCITHTPIVYCSQGFSEDTGYARHEVNSQNVMFTFLHGRQTSKQSIKQFEEAIRKQTTFEVQTILYWKSGVKRWYNVKLVPIRNDAEQVILLLILFNDICHLKPRISESPKRLWRKAYRQVMKKGNIDEFRRNMDQKKIKMSKHKPLDMDTLRQRTESMFIPAYGSEKLQLPKFVINHLSLPKIAWDVFVLVLILYTATVVPFSVAFEYSDPVINFFDTFVDSMFIIDIILTFFTTFVDANGLLVTKLKVIRISYLKGWFMLDVAASFPYSILVLQIGSESKIVGLIRILKIIRLVRLGKVSQKMGRLMQTSTVTLGMWLLVFCLCGHWMACIWYSIALTIDNPAIVKHSWLAVLADISDSPYEYINNGTKIKPFTGPTNASLYISALYYTMSSLTTCGFGNIAPNTSAEKVFGCITMLLGCVLYAFIFGQVTNIISQLQSNSNAFTEHLNSIKRFNSIYKVPPYLGKRLEDYFTSTWSITKGTDEEEILSECPRDLQSDLCLHIHRIIFDNNPAFGRLNQTSLRAIARYLWTIRTSPGDSLIYQGENVDTIYFVATGSLEVKHGSDLVGLIGPGDSFGVRLNFDDDTKSVFDVRACSFGSIHCINNMDIWQALKRYPGEYIKIKCDLVLAFDIAEEIKITTPNGEVYEKELPLSMKMGASKTPQPPSTKASNVLLPGDDVTELENIPNVDVLSGMSELKGELRRETERMNSKMGVVEAQMRLVLKILRKQNKIDIDPEIGSKLTELMPPFDDDENSTAEWFVADSKGWKRGPASRGMSGGLRKSASLDNSESEERENTAIAEENMFDDGEPFFTSVEKFNPDA